MNRFNFIFFIVIIIISLCIFFACEQTVDNSKDDDSTPASSVSSESTSSDSSESSVSSDMSSSPASSEESSIESSSLAASSESSSVSSTCLFDNFNSYSSASPWTPEGGWTKQGTPEWHIVAGYDGNGLQSDPLIVEGLIYLSYTGSNCTVSVKARATIITNAYGYGLCLQSSSSFYVLEIVYFSGAPGCTRIAIYKDGSMRAGQTYISDQLSSSIYYTLTLSTTGTTDPVVTAAISDGTTSQSVNWTDTGVTYGSTVFTGIYSGGAPSIIYDDFTVTEP